LREEARVEQECLREEADEARHPIEEALKAYEELKKANEELQQILRKRPIVHDSRANQMLRVGADPQPFMRKIMEEQVLPYFMVSKMAPFFDIRGS